jgi:hypothetical protein
VTDEVMTQTAPWPHDLEAAVLELRYVPGWVITLTEETRGQDCAGLTLSIYPDKPDSYHPEQHVRTVFTYPVPAASFNRESWEEWLWARIVDTENHERAEWFRFVVPNPSTVEIAEILEQDPKNVRDETVTERRPFKPAHADGWDPSVVRTVVSETVTNTPNAGRLVQVPCPVCLHHHGGRMGEHFTIEYVNPCREDGCDCQWGRG